MNKPVTVEELDILRICSDKVYFESDYKVLKSHNGFRKDNIHLFIGVPGGGKSTMARSLLLDILQNNCSVFVWLSEETRKDFIIELSRSGIGPDVINKLKIFSELDVSAKIKANIKNHISLLIDKVDPDIIFHDNMTTSCLYMGKSPGEQSNMSTWFKELAVKKNVPLVIFAHTGATVHDNMNRMIEANDIRGNKSITNIAQFLYIIQRVVEKDDIRTLVRTIKHRGQDPRDKLHLMYFSQEKRIFTMDFRVDFEAFKELWKKRNTLS